MRPPDFPFQVTVHQDSGSCRLFLLCWVKQVHGGLKPWVWYFCDFLIFDFSIQLSSHTIISVQFKIYIAVILRGTNYLCNLIVLSTVWKLMNIHFRSVILGKKWLGYRLHVDHIMLNVCICFLGTFLFSLSQNIIPQHWISILNMCRSSIFLVSWAIKIHYSWKITHVFQRKSKELGVLSHFFKDLAFLSNL